MIELPEPAFDKGSRQPPSRLGMAYKPVTLPKAGGDESTRPSWLPSSEPEPSPSTANYKKGAKPDQPNPEDVAA